METEIENGPLSQITDLRGFSSIERGEIIFSYLVRKIPCTQGGGHNWTACHWNADLYAWHWGPCKKCGVQRFVQVSGNFVTWHPNDYLIDSLEADERFERFYAGVHRHLRDLHFIKSGFAECNCSSIEPNKLVALEEILEMLGLSSEGSQILFSIFEKAWYGNLIFQIGDTEIDIGTLKAKCSDNHIGWVRTSKKENGAIKKVDYDFPDGFCKFGLRQKT
jgi:hypothetical protein